jgi:hypothetical protein
MITISVVSHQTSNIVSVSIHLVANTRDFELRCQFFSHLVFSSSHNPFSLTTTILVVSHQTSNIVSVPIHPVANTRDADGAVTHPPPTTKPSLQASNPSPPPCTTYGRPSLVCQFFSHPVFFSSHNPFSLMTMILVVSHQTSNIVSMPIHPVANTHDADGAAAHSPLTTKPSLQASNPSPPPVQPMADPRWCAHFFLIRFFSLLIIPSL